MRSENTEPIFGAAEPGSWAELDARFKPGLIADLRTRAATFNLTPQGQRYLRIAAESPSRRVRSTAKSSSGIYPSEKLGVTVGFESRTLELPAVDTFEHDDDVVAYFDQAPRVLVRYMREGRKRGHPQTPDFLVVRRDEAVLVECKPLAKILTRNASDPGFYVKDGTRWACPALQAAARQLGMRHEVWTEDSFSPIRLRNLRMLGDYMNPGSHIDGYDDALAAIQRVLEASARANIEELLKELAGEVCVDHLYAAVARGGVAFNQDAAPLSEQGRCYIYRDDRTRRAFELSELSRVPCSDRIVAAEVEIAEGTLLQWDQVTWRCVNAGVTEVMLGRGDHHELLPRTVVNTLVRAGAIKAAPTGAAVDHDPKVHERIAKASENDLRTANLRHARITRYLAPGAPAPGSRSERRYVANYKRAEISHGNGYIGLLPGHARSGNREQRLMKDVLDIVMRVVNERYLNATNVHKKAIFTLIVDECQSKALPPPSYSWFCRFADRLPAFKVLRARKGSKGAYPLEPRQDTAGNIDKMEPERALERAHIDHTLIDVECLFGETSEPLGRCWLTVMIDHHSRCILAHYLTFDAPSYRSVLMVMRKCVQRHGRLPESMVVDGGKEFQSVWFETSCALYRIKVIRRPIAKARFGSQIERMFGTTNSNFFHFLSGNTQLRKNVRQLTDEVDPDTHAIWTLPELNKALSKYFYEVYEALEHRELLVTPRFAFEKSMERHGRRPDRRVVFNELFRITTSPAPEKGTAKVQRDGVKIHYLYYYSADLQRHLGKQLRVRYDPFDKSLAWAFADGKWLRLKSRHHELLRNLTEHDVDLAVAEWRKRRSDVEKMRLSEPVLVKFLKEIMGTETLLLARKRSAEERRIREAEDDANDYVDDDQTDDAADVEGVFAPSSHTDTERARSTTRSSFADIGDELEILETL